MSEIARRSTALTVLLAFALASVPALASPAPARLEGVVIGAGGEPAAGYRVVLVEPSGGEVAEALTDSRGLYSFSEVAAGDYAMGLRTPEGEQAPVLADPVNLAPGMLVRRDVALQPVRRDAARRAAANYGLKEWWVSRTGTEKGLVIGGFVGGLALIWFLVDSGDDEVVTSPANP